MRRTQLFSETLRQDPSGSEVAGHLLLLRGMFIQPLASGLYSFLPLGARVKSKVERILREEMEAIGGQEVLLPLVQPADLWRETGRYERVGAELTRFQDRAERDMVLAMTHEEVATDLLRRHVRTYRQLPVVLFQMQTKFRDEPRARGGLIRAREFVMKDAYSGHATSEELDTFYERIYGAYLRIFRRVGLNVLPVESDVGMMGGSMAHEFMYLSPIGEDQIAICEECGYAANAQVATFVKEGSDEQLQPLEEVATPDASTISALSTLLEIPASRTAKAAFFVADGRLIFAVVRGDMEVNETKLLNVVNASELRPARADDLAGTGIVAGYASPVGVSGATVVVDDLVATSPNLVAGANRPGVHLRNTNLGRDYEAEVVADISAVYDGAQCPRCSGPLHLQRGIEVGNTFKLGVTYSNALGASYLDESGHARPIVIGSYGIGIGRLIACIAEEYRDDRGLMCPVSVAPYHVYLVGLDLDDDNVRSRCESLYTNLTRAGRGPIRRSPGTGRRQINDADLLGIPLRMTVSRRTEASSAVEIKLRSSNDRFDVAVDDVIGEILSRLDDLRRRDAIQESAALPAADTTP